MSRNQLKMLLITCFIIFMGTQMSCLVIANGDKPALSSPPDLLFMEGSENQKITWVPTDDSVNNPTYTITMNDDKAVEREPWTSGENIVFELPDLNYGYYAIVLILNDGFGNTAEDKVIVRVQRGFNLDPANALALLLGIPVPIVILGAWEIKVRKQKNRQNPSA